MAPEYKIRPALPTHVPMLPGIERAAASLFAGILPPALLDATTPLTVLEEAQQTGRLWVAVDDCGSPVGFVLVELIGARIHIAEFDVAPHHQRRGIGTLLLREVGAWAADRGFAEITLTTYRDIPWNAPAYRRMGFELVESSELDEHLRSHLEQEAAAGFGVHPRVAMRQKLSAI